MTSRLSGFWVREATTGNTSSFTGYHLRATALPAELRRDLWRAHPFTRLTGVVWGIPNQPPPPTLIKNEKGVRFDLRATLSWIFVEKGWEVRVALSFYSRSREVFCLVKNKYNRDCHFDICFEIEMI